MIFKPMHPSVNEISELIWRIYLVMQSVLEIWQLKIYLGQNVLISCLKKMKRLSFLNKKIYFEKCFGPLWASMSILCKIPKAGMCKYYHYTYINNCIFLVFMVISILLFLFFSALYCLISVLVKNKPLIIIRRNYTFIIS